MHVNLTGKSLSFEDLKRFIIQHEASRRVGVQGGSGTSQSVQAMAARPSGSQQRCFHCDGLEHIGRNCPRKDLEGKLCYFCKEYTTDHIAANCPLNIGSKRRDRRYDNNNRCDYKNNGGGRGFKRKIESNNDESNSKRSKFNNRGRGNYKNRDRGGKQQNNGQQEKKNSESKGNLDSLNIFNTGLN